MAVRPNANRAITRIEEAAQDRAREIAEFIALNANLLAPVDDDRHTSHRGTRRLAGSYSVKMINGEAVVQSNREYWIYVEKGTRRQAPEPHVEPAIELARAVYDR